MGKTIRLTAAQAMVRWLEGQMTEEGARFIEGMWAIFGHGNVAGIGEALHARREHFPTWRGQNEQTMAHAVIPRSRAMVNLTQIVKHGFENCVDLGKVFDRRTGEATG